MTKSTITRERLQEIAEDGFLKHGESKELARMALAAMDGEPVIVVGDDGGDALSYRRLIQSFEPGTKLYRHAQTAPVVPDDVSIFEAAIEECKTCDSIDEHAWNHGVLAVIAKYESCRAAMLQELKKVQELKRSAGVTKMCRCCTPNLRRNPIAARRKTSSFQRKAQSITVIYQSANAQGVRLLPESAQKWPPTLW